MFRLSPKRSRHPQSGAQFDSPSLGLFTYNGEVDLWEATIHVARDKVILGLAGDATAPAPELLRRATQIIEDYADLSSKVDALLAVEAPKFRHDRDAVLNLRIEQIDLHNPAAPNRGMIYFANANDDRAWRCDYEDGNPRHLGYDD